MSKVCSVCFKNEFKYKCPRCGIQTCSLSCVKSHKVLFACSGEVDVKQYISNEELKAKSEVIQRDYNFLTNIGRSIELSKRDGYQTAKPTFQKRRLKYNNRNGRSKITKHDVVNKGKICVIMMPPGMLRARLNKTIYDKKREEYVWTIEYVWFDDDEEKNKLVVHRVPESGTVAESITQNIEKFKNCPGLLKLDFKTYVTRIQPNNEILNDDILVEIDANAAFKKLFEAHTVVEFPTIFILSASQSKLFKIDDGTELSDGEIESSQDESHDTKLANGRPKQTEMDIKVDREIPDQTEVNKDNYQNKVDTILPLSISKIPEPEPIATVLTYGYSSDSDSGESDAPVEISATK